jgi:TatD DNase family protein
MTPLIDIGVNLTNNSLLRDLDGVMQRAADAGVRQMVVTGTSLEVSEQARELCMRFPERLVYTCGVHPHHASEWDALSPDRLRQLAQQPGARAIGETGLDFNRSYSPQGAQETAFRRQLELAAELEMPVFCHQRDAHSRFVAILREYRERLGAVVVHCFTDSREALLECLEMDCHIGITGWICDERRGLELQQLVRLIPAERLLLETDAPYLLPRDLEPKPVSRINEPAYLPHILEAVARHRGQRADELAAQCLANTLAFFDL